MPLTTFGEAVRFSADRRCKSLQANPVIRRLFAASLTSNRASRRDEPAAFCPNCAAPNVESQHYCRMWGLRLDAIVAELTAQDPSPEVALLLKRQRQIERLGIFSLTIAGIIGLCLLIAVASYYKLAILG